MLQHADPHGHAHAHVHHEESFFRKYIWSHDHKMIGKQFFFTALFFYAVGGLLALGVRSQYAWPAGQKWERVEARDASGAPVLEPSGVPRLEWKAVGEAPWYARLTNKVLKPLLQSPDDTVQLDAYNRAFTMHASVMIFLVIIPMLVGAFGNFVTPLQIGAGDMAFPFLNALSYWMMWPAIGLLGWSFFVDGGAAQGGWTGYPPLSESAFTPGWGTTFWTMAVFIAGASSIMGAVNYITTIVKMRAPGMHLFRMPMTTWAIFITAILVLFATPVLGSAMIMMTLDRTVGTSFFLPPDILASGAPISTGQAGGGQVVMWQHLFWFYSHPAVYIMILPAMGIVSDVLSTFARKPLFGYKPMVFSVAGIAGLGFIVWGHHM
ncbi:MAG TPA: cbb3-type cytochrome c oxidase subunit I, partial [Planctomycetota bacterium]|nr:cbb3-type cytochrome c oxidase subunit I [Planctomycetota bacterium]